MEKYVEYWLKTKERLKETLHPQIYNESFSYIDEVHKFRNNHIYIATTRENLSRVVLLY